MHGTRDTLYYNEFEYLLTVFARIGIRVEAASQHCQQQAHRGHVRLSEWCSQKMNDTLAQLQTTKPGLRNDAKKITHPTGLYLSVAKL
jgi:hypothetical protein